MSSRVLCFGDSNTYGYAPHLFSAGRYPAQIRWTGRLDRTPGWTILNHGENGREIPREPWELRRMEELLTHCGALDVMVVMLGGNDLLQGPGHTAEDVTARMRYFLTGTLEILAASGQNAKLLLLAPPPMQPGTWVTEQRLLGESTRLAACYRTLAGQLDIGFADTGGWGVALTFDGVHFSEDGHQTFARQAASAIQALLSPPCGANRGGETPQ